MAHMSFLPEDYLNSRIELRTNMICLMLFVIVLAAIVAAYFVTNRQRAEVENRHAAINIRYREAAERITQLDELRARKQDMMNKAQITAKLVEPVPRTLILSELINHMPSRLSLLEFDLETKVIRAGGSRSRTTLQKAKADANAANRARGQRVEPAVTTDVNMSLVGVTPTDLEVAEFMRSIGSMPLFRNVNLSFSEQVKINDRPMRKFQIDMKLGRNVDILEIQPTQVSRVRNPMAPGEVTAADVRLD